MNSTLIDDWSHRIKAIRENVITTSVHKNAFYTVENNKLVLLYQANDTIKLLFLLDIVTKVIKADGQSAGNAIKIITM